MIQEQPDLADEDIAVSEFDYAEDTVWALDFGPEVDGTVEVVDGTAIVVVDGEQYDIEVDDDAGAFMHNGILTIEVSP